MYEEADLRTVLQQRNKRWLVLLIPVAVLAAVVVAAFIARVEWLASAATIVAGTLLIGGYELFIKPLSDYARFVSNMLHGRKREEELAFAGLSQDVSMVDGVRCHAMTAIDYDEKGRPYERLFYFDAEKPFPGFEAGEMLHIVFHDKAISSLTKAEK